MAVTARSKTPLRALYAPHLQLRSTLLRSAAPHQREFMKSSNRRRPIFSKRRTSRKPMRRRIPTVCRLIASKQNVILISRMRPSAQRWMKRSLLVYEYLCAGQQSRKKCFSNALGYTLVVLEVP